MARESVKYTITAGTPIQLSPIPLIVSDLLVQAEATAGGGMIYLMLGVRPDGPAPVANNNPTIQIPASAGATSPGGSYGNTVDQYIDLNRAWLDGATNGNTVTVSYTTRSR